MRRARWRRRRLASALRAGRYAVRARPAPGRHDPLHGVDLPRSPRGGEVARVFPACQTRRRAAHTSIIGRCNKRSLALCTRHTLGRKANRGSASLPNQLSRRSKRPRPKPRLYVASERRATAAKRGSAARRRPYRNHRRANLQRARSRTDSSAPCARSGCAPRAANKNVALAGRAPHSVAANLRRNGLGHWAAPAMTTL